MAAMCEEVAAFHSTILFEDLQNEMATMYDEVAAFCFDTSAMYDEVAAFRFDTSTTIVCFLVKVDYSTRYLNMKKGEEKVDYTNGG
ncbi:hypothetical protein AMTR_s00001p00043510 [Amborella trichopoda]|uniref:Uncharacterized protein n=1 Tax=Amborella trichopoda TaxID=13333 RepID=W1NKZ2_AMBTC|nr:hypothetical protein AMTR_s00001p00043510 [Amborella trichopoda]